MALVRVLVPVLVLETVLEHLVLGLGRPVLVWPQVLVLLVLRQVSWPLVSVYQPVQRRRMPIEDA